MNVSVTKMKILTVFGAIGSFIANLFGGWGEDIITLLIFMGTDFLLGVLMYYDCLSICEFKKTEALEEVQFVIAGKRIIAQAVYDILTDIMQEKKVHLLDEDELMAAKGAFRLAELYYKWKEGE